MLSNSALRQNCNCSIFLQMRNIGLLFHSATNRLWTMKNSWFDGVLVLSFRWRVHLRKLLNSYSFDFGMKSSESIEVKSNVETNQRQINVKNFYFYRSTFLTCHRTLHLQVSGTRTEIYSIYTNASPIVSPASCLNVCRGSYMRCDLPN